jgi:hypothetical protein
MADWQMQERGWYTSDLGGIAEEDRGRWFFWPRDVVLSTGPIGPWKTLADAKEQAEIWSAKQSAHS